MYATKSRKEYLAQKIRSASPMELVLIVYDAAIGFLEGVPECWKNNEHIQAGERIIKAQKCIRELKRALNMEVGKEIAENLFGLYRYLDNSLTNASIKRDEKSLARVLRMMKELRETWGQVAKQNPDLQPASPDHSGGASYINMYK